MAGDITKNKTCGFFVVFEGGEGCGKSTQIEMLKTRLLKEGVKAVFTREPGGTNISEKVRDIILDNGNAEMCGTTELLLYAAARAQHVGELIKPALDRGERVVCDRFSLSTLAYQVYGRGLSLKDAETADAVARQSIEPDVTFFFDLPPDKGFSRKKGQPRDRLETETPEFHKKVYEGYKSLAAQNPDRIVTVDASTSAEAVHGFIVGMLAERGFF